MKDFKLTVPSNTEFIGDIDKDKNLIQLENGKIKVDIPLEGGYLLRLPDDFCKVVDKTVGAVTIELGEYEYKEILAEYAEDLRYSVCDLLRNALGLTDGLSHKSSWDEDECLIVLLQMLLGEKKLGLSREFREALSTRVFEKSAGSTETDLPNGYDDPYSLLADLIVRIMEVRDAAIISLPEKDQPVLYHDMCIKGKLSDSMAYTINIDKMPQSIRGPLFDVSIDQRFIHALEGCTTVDICSIDYDAMYCADHGLEPGEVCSTNLDAKYTKTLSSYLCLYAYNDDFSISRFICIKSGNGNDAMEVKP